MGYVKTGEAFGVIYYKTGTRPSRQSAKEAVDALVIAIEYLRRGYHVLLTDATVEALGTQDGTVDLEWIGNVRAAPARSV
jgi:hypothetical protein